MFSAHLHLMFSHVPILLSIAAAGILIFGLIKNNSLAIKISLWLSIIAAAGITVVYLTGDASAELIAGISNVSKDVIENHETFGHISFAFVLSFAALSAFIIYTESKQKKIRSLFYQVLLIIAVSAAVAAGIAGYLGGQIRHSEIITEQISK